MISSKIKVRKFIFFCCFILSVVNVIRVIFIKFINLFIGRSSNFYLNFFCYIWFGFLIDFGNSGKIINFIIICEILSFNYCFC